MRLEKRRELKEKIVLSEPEKKNVHHQHTKAAIDIRPLASISSNRTINKLPIADDVFTGKSMTFEELTKLNYKQFNTNSKDEDNFNPSDILDINGDDSDDEILRRFRTKKKSVQKSGLFAPSHRKVSNSLAGISPLGVGGTSNITANLTPISSGINNLGSQGLSKGNHFRN